MRFPHYISYKWAEPSFSCRAAQGVTEVLYTETYSLHNIYPLSGNQSRVVCAAALYPSHQGPFTKRESESELEISFGWFVSQNAKSSTDMNRTQKVCNVGFTFIIAQCEETLAQWYQTFCLQRLTTCYSLHVYIC